MSQQLNSFIHLVFLGFVALFPVVNPIGTAFIISPYFSELTRAERLTVVKKITFYSFIICAVTLFVGHWILEVFGLSVPIIQLAGGIMICKIGWGFLSSDTNDKPDEKTSTQIDLDRIPLIQNKIFYPITFPITTGAGTISVLFTLSASSANQDMSLYLVNVGALLVSVIGICVLIFIFYLNTNRLISYIGSHNEKIINSIMAFLIFCVGLQIAIGGIFHLIKTYS
ncbi:MarC family protein [Mucilaginibacter sp. E4BP6]|jgi:multiple antibiotic resistance protein|uniref:MarC family protein n=1 Tax=Mucilaginibacter sp. E4BP6 TaxID=2723089 RepID=UPI0015C72AB7|nr:MarC family protein [Mucilaginibacter sp. E4BP6]NYE65598.1 multiple antibiotic resistance protein [Mucilaginibacter sp. E4BP6]